MKKSFLLIAMACSILFMAGCGFRPLYGTGTTLADTESVLDNVSITSIGGEAGQRLRNELIDRFYHHGFPEEARYILTIRLGSTRRDLVIQKDDVTSREQIVMIANYDLRDRETSQSISRGVVRAVGSYNILGSQYTNIVSRNTARDLALKELADKMALRVATILENQQ